MGFGLVCFVMGELLYARRRTLAGLLWVAGYFVLAPLGIVLLAAKFYSEGTILSTVMALLCSTALPFWYGAILWRYLLAGDIRRE